MKNDDNCPELEDLIKRFSGPIGYLLLTITGEMHCRRRNGSLYNHVKKCKKCFTIIPHIWEEIARSDEVNKAITIIKDPLSKITDREKIVIKMRFGLTNGVTYSLKQIGNLSLSLTGERIRQIEKKILVETASALHAEYPTFKLIPLVATCLNKKNVNQSAESDATPRVLTYPKSYQRIQLILLKELRT